MVKANEKFTLKLLIDKNSNRVLFGEASKDFVDFIFSLLSLPLSAVTMLLTKDAMVGSIGEVYSSLSKLNGTYVLSKKKASSLLNPRLASTSNLNANFLLPPETHEHAKRRRFYICSKPMAGFHSQYAKNASRGCAYVSEVQAVACPGCNASMNTEAQLVNPKSDGSVVEGGSDEEEGLVQGLVMYSVMDDLTVVPVSTISSITLLNKFQIKDLGSLEEKTVGVGFDEGVKLLKASLQSKTVLTDVFLKKKKNGASTARTTRLKT